MSEFLWNFPSKPLDSKIEKPTDIGWELEGVIVEEEKELIPEEAS